MPCMGRLFALVADGVGTLIHTAVLLTSVVWAPVPSGAGRRPAL